MAGRYLERRGRSKSLAGGVDLRTAMLRSPDLAVETVIYAGASNECWSEAMMRHFLLAQ